MAIVNPPDTPLPPKPGKPGGLGEKLELTMMRFTIRVLNAAKMVLTHIIRAGLELFLEALEPTLISTYRPLLEDIRDQPDVPDSFKHVINEALSGEHQAGSAILMSLGTQAGGAVMGSVLNSLLAPVTYAVNRKIQPWRIEPTTAATLAITRPELEDHLKGDVYDGGLDDLRFSWLKQAVLSRLSAGDWVRYYFLKGRNKSQLIEHLKRSGFDATQVDELLTIAEGIPGLGDIVRMAVREAWNDAVAATFGYDEDFPAEFGEWASKLGYSPDWAKRYWRAHWDLPSPQMGFEMFQRGIISQDELHLLLRSLDIPRFWRDKLIRLAYNTITRVDVRRMWSSGHITEFGELVRRYRDVGYSPDDAVDLAQWTVAEYTQGEREANKTDILKAYELGRFTRQEAINALVSIDYQDWIAEVWLANVDNKKANAELNKKITYVKKMYVARQIKDGDVHAQLSPYGVSAEEVDNYLRLWKIERDARDRLPTKTDAHDFFIKNIISEADYRAMLRAQRYTENAIDWYVARSKRYLVEQARKDAEAAMAEAEKLERAKITSKYDIDVANINIQIAQANLAIADLKASVTPEMTYDEYQLVMQSVQEYQLLIKELKLQKAQVRKDYLESIKPEEEGGE